jgi:hypothetical protein
VRRSAVGRRGILAAAFFCALPLAAHPGTGIVQDARGNVFYTDLVRVWRIDPDGRKTIAVRNVHTHELCLDADGNLFGEHLWYEGEATDTWGYRVWRLAANGVLSEVIAPRKGFRKEYSFVRDGAGNMYRAQPGSPTRIEKRTPGGALSILAECGDCREVRGMAATAEGTVLFLDAGDLREVSPAGRLRTITRRLSRRVWTQPHVSDEHALMGIWTDAAGNAYVASYGSREVKRISRAGDVRVVARSRVPWSPTGGLVTAGGDLWLLESSMTNAVRVRRVARDGRERIF